MGLLPRRDQALKAIAVDEAKLANIQKQIGELNASMAVPENMRFSG